MAREDVMVKKRKRPDYENDLSIDKYALDREFVRQPVLFMDYAKLAAEAEAVAKRKHEAVKIIRSQIIVECLAQAAKDGSKPPPSQTIEAAYRMDQRHREAKNQQIEAEEMAAVLKDAAWAMRQRKNMLEKLADLHLAGYYSSPRSPDGTDHGSDEKLKERVNAKTKDKAKRRK